MAGIAERIMAAAPVTTYGGLARCAGWTLFFLWLLGRLLPAPDGGAELRTINGLIADPRVFSTVLDSNDPRAYRDYRRAAGDDRFLIAWIGGSSLQIWWPNDGKPRPPGQPGTLPEAVVAQLGPPPAGREVSVALYLISGMRILDQYQALLHAISQQPDLIVFSINPVWAYNRYALVYRPSSLGRGALLTLKQGGAHAPLGAYLALATPAQWLWGATAPALPLLADRWEYHHHLYRVMLRQLRTALASGLGNLLPSRWLSLIDPPPPRPAPPGKPPKASSRRQPWQQWIAARRFPQAADLNTTDPEAWQRNLINLIEPRPDTTNGALLRAMFSAVRDSGIPALAYQPPEGPIGLKVGRATFAAVDGQLTRLGEEFATPRFRIIGANPHSQLHGLDFRDLLHLNDPGDLPTWLAEQLQPLLAQSGAPR